MRVLITGHRGSLGRRLNERLLQLGHQVSGVDLKDGVDCADVSNLNSFRGVEVVFHLAAHLEFPKKNTIEACHGILDFAKQENAKVIYASSAAIYNPTNMYAAHKLYGECLFRSELKNLAVLRIFNIYGGNGIGLIDKIEKNEDLKINGNGEQRRDYVHINDVVDAFVAAMEYDLRGTVDIGTGVSHSVNEVLNLSKYHNFYYSTGDGGITDSKANLSYSFPWRSMQTLERYFHETSRLVKAPQ